MKFVTEFRRAEMAQGLAKHIRHHSKTPARFMEFCGGHTVAIFRYGIRGMLPSDLKMVSGPGCPVCVTANSDLDKAIYLAGMPGVIITTFGDMFKVPGSYSSLERAKAGGADVRMVYSTMDALDIARSNPTSQVVFLGVGFETTAPTVAASVIQAQSEGLGNYYVLSQHKLCPPVIRALLGSGEVRLEGLICPGHVSAIIGSHPWEVVARDYKIPCVISGFEPLDILKSVDMLVSQLEEGRCEVEIAYMRGVHPQGNERALELMDRVFQPCPADWRGVGVVPESGLGFRDEFRRFDAEQAFEITPPPPHEAKGCICGDVLRGVKTPLDCNLFKKVCTPESPVGPCMVSSEGSCAAYYRFGDDIEG